MNKLHVAEVETITLWFKVQLKLRAVILVLLGSTLCESKQVRLHTGLYICMGVLEPEAH